MSAVGAHSGVLVRKTAVPGTRSGGFFSSMRTRSASGISCRRVFSNSRRLPWRHVYITIITRPPRARWHPSTFDDLQKIGAEEAEVDEEERHHQGRCRGQRPAPYLPDHHKCHYPGDNHRSRHGNAIGRRKRTRGSEHGHEQKHADQQNEVHARHIDLSVLRFRSVSDFEAREEAELNPLLADGIGAADDGLTRDHRRGSRQRDHRQQRPFGVEQEERVLERLRIGEQQRALSEIVQRKRREDEPDPGGLDRLTAENARRSRARATRSSPARCRSRARTRPRTARGTAGR